MQQNTHLEESLQNLVDEFRMLTSKYFQELRPIGAALMEIKPCGGKDKESFIRSLKTLSAAVIAVRKEKKNPPPVRALSVPPYDLFLPFKAESIGSDDSEVFAGVIKTFNERMDQLKDHWSPFNDTPTTEMRNSSDLELLRHRILAQFDKCNDLAEFDLFKPTLKAQTDLFVRKIVTAANSADDFRGFISSLYQVFWEGLPNEVQKWQSGQNLPLKLTQPMLDVIKGESFRQMRKLRHKSSHDDPDTRAELAPIYQSLIGVRAISGEDSHRWLDLQIAVLENLASALEQLSRTLESSKRNAIVS